MAASGNRWDDSTGLFDMIRSWHTLTMVVVASHNLFFLMTRIQATGRSDEQDIYGGACCYSKDMENGLNA